jgi:DNA-binding NarL/FixJ family response regulator
MKQKISVAIADDHPSLIKGLRLLIENIGDYKVIIEALNGRDLLDKIAISTKKPDMVLLDISMPIMNGFDALEEITKKWKGIKVVMQSMFFDEHNIIKAFRLGASAFISKESDGKEIATILKNVVEHGYYYSKWTERNVLSKIHDTEYNTMITDKEREFLEYVCSDLTYAQIGEQLGKSARTIETYRDALFEKLQVRSRTALAIYAIKAGIVRI